MAFNADAMVEALRPPAFTTGGRTFTGRIMSTEEWVRLHAEKDQLIPTTEEELAKLTIENVRRVEAAFFNAWFPKPWWCPRTTWNPAWRAFKRLPEKVQQAAIADFSECQRKALPGLEGNNLPPDAAPSPPLATTT